MATTTIQINKETKDLLDGLKDKYSLGTFDNCVSSLALFVLRNDINPKDDFVGDFRTELINLETRLLKKMEDSHKRITKDNASLRNWVGGITKDHLIPITKKIEKIYDLEISNKSANKQEISSFENPLNLSISETPKQLNEEDNVFKSKLEEQEKKASEYYSKYNNVKQALFKIINSAKIEQGGMLSPQKIVVNLSLEEWEKLKENL